MTKPLLANSAKAKADFKAMMRPGTSFKLNIWGWQIANPNYAKAEITMALAVPSEGVLNCGEPTCSAGSRSFGTTATTRPLFCAERFGETRGSISTPAATAAAARRLAEASKPTETTVAAADLAAKTAVDEAAPAAAISDMCALLFA
jgi:hypothetical protein